MNKKPIVKVNGSSEEGYSVSIDGDSIATYGVGRNTVGHHLCDFVVDQADQIEYLNAVVNRRDEKIQELQIELEQEKKKLRQFKRTFVQVRALHDLRNHVCSLMETASVRADIDEELRSWIKRYQDRVESWPVDAATGEVLPHVKRATEGIHRRMHRCDLRNEDTTVVTTKPEKHRIRLTNKQQDLHVVGFLNRHVSVPEFHERVGRWQKTCTDRGSLLLMHVGEFDYYFYEAPENGR